MKEVKGYVLLAQQKGTAAWQMMGPNENGEGLAESIKSNGFTPFPTAEIANEVQKKIKDDYKRKIRIKKLEMQIAETLEERDTFESLRGLVVIMFSNDHLGVEILGRGIPEGIRIDGIPGCVLEANGLKPFLNYKKAMDSFNEIISQETKAQVATFRLT